MYFCFHNFNILSSTLFSSSIVLLFSYPITQKRNIIQRLFVGPIKLDSVILCSMITIIYASFNEPLQSSSCISLITFSNPSIKNKTKSVNLINPPSKYMSIYPLCPCVGCHMCFYHKSLFISPNSKLPRIRGGQGGNLSILDTVSRGIAQFPP